MNKNIVRGAAAVVGVLLVIYLFVLRGRVDRPVAVVGSGSDRGAQIAPPAAGSGTSHADSDLTSPGSPAPRWVIDRDPTDGPLRIDGQVVGEDGTPVAGADVWVLSVPPRTTTSEDDGSFTFEKLVGRDYTLGSRKDDLAGGPVQYKPTTKGEPLIIHMVRGSTLEVLVQDEAGNPIAGAQVALIKSSSLTATSGADGKALLRGMAGGWVGVKVDARGYAQVTAWTPIAGSGATGNVTVTLRRGAEVSGLVVDERGKPIEGASVVVTSNNAAAWAGPGSSAPAMTDATGAFTFVAIAAGTYIANATDGEHAPADSETLTLDGATAHAGVKIVMKAGTRVAGVVVDDKGTPVAYATVRIAAAAGGGDAQMMRGFDTRQTTTDDKGAFEIKGLSHRAMQIRAESEAAASAITPVDLTTKSELTGVKLVLDVTGVIAGVVVDEHGGPIAEIQVNAFPDIMGGASTDGIALAGMSSSTTDGAGAFTIRGLPDGPYRLWATRSNTGDGFGMESTGARTGDKRVRITLASPGSITGTIVVAGSSGGPSQPPTMATVQIGWQPPVAAIAGVFTVNDVAAGKHDLTFHGSEFSEYIKHDVVVEPGKPTDLGTITVKRGRRLVGKVVDSKGQPVGGARIKVGTFLISSGSSGGSADDLAKQDELMGVRSTTSDADGTFVVVGIPADASSAYAEHPTGGASLSIEIPAGADQPPEVTLKLRGFGAVTGKVTAKSQPLAGAQISASSQGGASHAVMVTVATDGTYVFDKLTEGPQTLTVMQQGMMSMTSTKAVVTVVAGQKTTKDIDVPVGDITAEVTVKPLPGQQVDAAQVFLFRGVVAARTGKDLMDGFFSGSGSADGGSMKFWLGKAVPPPKFDSLTAGGYSMCTIPITGSMTDPQFMQRIQGNVMTLKVYCKQITIAPTPKLQSFTHEVPAMDPLPAPTP